MKATVAYYSKTGNTRKVAEVMAQALHVTALPLNLVTKGRKSRDELVAEKDLWGRALSEARESELVIIGSPTQFRKPHPLVVKFLEEVEPASVAVFCTYYGMLGATLIDMEAILRQHGVQLVGALALRVGTERYRFRHDVSQYEDALSDSHIAIAREFARRFLQAVEPVKTRLRGACGRNCENCVKYRSRECEGAGVRCWSGRRCPAFDCCILRKSLDSCERCAKNGHCLLREKPFGGEPVRTKEQL